MATRVLVLTLGLLLATSDLRSAGRSSQVAPQSTATPQERLQQLEGKVADLEKSGGSNAPALATALNELAIFIFNRGISPRQNRCSAAR